MEAKITTTKIIRQYSKVPINYNTYGSWRFEPEGILSENIFGPVFDYTCACNIVRPRDYVCPICNVKSESSVYRFIRTAEIEFPVYFIKGLFYLPFNLTKKLLHSQYAYYIDGDNIEFKKVSYLAVNPMLFDHLILATIKKITEQDYFIDDRFIEHYKDYQYYYEKVAVDLIQLVEDKLKSKRSVLYEVIHKIFYKIPYNKIVTNKVKLLPAGFRYMHFNSTTSDANISIYTNYYNRRYIKLIFISNQLKDLDITSTLGSFYYCLIKSNVTSITETILHYFTKKKGLYRQQLLGRRVDLSYRAVLVGDPFLYVNEISIPYHGFLHIAFLDVVKHMPYNLKKNIEIVEHAIKTVNIPNFLKEICDKLLQKNDYYVLLMRQPVLHLPSTEKFKVTKLTDELVIKTNQIVWSGYNADSDGDTVVIFRITEDDQNKFATYNHILLPRGDLNFAIEYDSLAGFI